MASFNPFDDLLTGNGSNNNNPFGAAAQPWPQSAVSPPQGNGGRSGGSGNGHDGAKDTLFDDAGGFFDSPAQPQSSSLSSPAAKAHNMSFSGLAEGDNDGGSGGPPAGRSEWPEYAVKVISTERMRALGYERAVAREIAILRLVAHPGVARLVSAFRWRDGAYQDIVAVANGARVRLGEQQKCLDAAVQAAAAVRRGHHAGWQSVLMI